MGSADRKVAKGTDAGTYEMNLKPEDFKNNSANFTNVKFQIVDARSPSRSAPDADFRYAG